MPGFSNDRAPSGDELDTDLSPKTLKYKGPWFAACHIAYGQTVQHGNPGADSIAFQLYDKVFGDDITQQECLHYGRAVVAIFVKTAIGRRQDTADINSITQNFKDRIVNSQPPSLN